MGYLIALIGAAVLLAAALIAIAFWGARLTAGVEYANGAVWQTHDYAYGIILQEQLRMTTYNAFIERSAPLYQRVQHALMQSAEYRQFVEIGGYVLVTESTSDQTVRLTAMLHQVSQIVVIQEEAIVNAASTTELICDAILTMTQHCLHIFVNSREYVEQMEVMRQRLAELGNALANTTDIDAAAVPGLDAMLHEMSDLRQQLAAFGAIPAEFSSAPTHLEQVWQARYELELLPVREGCTFTTSAETLPPPTEEDYERMRGLLDALMRNDEHERLAMEHRTQARLIAHGNAMAFLKEHLTAEQASCFEEHNYFYVTGGSTGKTYRIRGRAQMNVDEMRLDRVTGVLIPVKSYCVVTEDEDIPVGDQWLMQKLMLEHDEKKFLKTAHTNEIFGVDSSQVGRFIDAIDRMTR